MSGHLYLLRLEGGPFDGFEGVSDVAPVRLYVREVDVYGDIKAFSKPRERTEPYVEVERRGTTVRYVFEDIAPVAEWCGAVPDALSSVSGGGGPRR